MSEKPSLPTGEPLPSRPSAASRDREVASHRFVPQDPRTGLDDGLHGLQPAWQNWSGGQQAMPSAKWSPHDEDELRQQVRNASNVRVVGAGHSFSPLVPTSGAIMSLDRLSGLISHDTQTQQACLWAGTRQFDAGPLLHGIGQAMPNVGDIDRQSLAGVLSTATHGTGITLPCFAADAAALRLVTAQGDVLECSRDHDIDLFRAAAVSLGALGVITQVTLQNVPSFRLRERVHLQPLDQLLPEVDTWIRQHRHFELKIFPHSRIAIVKTSDLTDQMPTEETHGADAEHDAMLKLSCELTRWLPGILGRGVQSMVGPFLHPSDRVNWSYKIFPSKRNVRFNEMEYEVPIAVGAACLDEVCRAISAAKIAVFIPLEFRFVAADDLWLSPFQSASGEPRCSISVHQYYKQDYQPLFAVTEPILRRYGGRPHWGKLHTLDAAELDAMYPDFERFLHLRNELDPGGKFLNPYLRQLFGKDPS